MLHKPSDDLPWDPAITKKWLPVDLYTGGAEHSVLHLMYSRFVTMALHDWGYLDFEEPFPNFYAHGLVIKDGAKMSKSKGNVVNPDEYIKLYGADALRLYLMFMGPFSEGGDFRDAAMEGMGRWVGRVWRMAQTSLKSQNPMTNPVLTRAMHKLIKKVGEDIEKRHYNTAIAAMMEFTNLVSDQGGAPDPGLLDMFLRVLAPFAPHITEELWQMLQRKEQGLHSKGHAHASGGEYVSIHAQQWPAYNPEYLTEETVIVVIQVNGKLRDSIRIDVDNSRNQDIIEAKSRESVKVRKYLEGVSVRTIVFIPGKLINFVTG